MKTHKRKINTPALYRAQLSCKIGKDVIKGETKPPDGTTKIEYALYLLCSAIEDIALAMEEKEAGK
jgi:hypothetical protein